MHKYIKRSVFIDYNKNVVNLLEKRIRTLDINNAEVYKGNYFNTDDIDKATDKLNRHSLTLAFIDPTDCSVPYKTLKFLKNKFNKLDIIYNFSFGTDVRRNIRTAIEEPQSKVREKYSNVLGGDSFFKDPEIIKLGKNSINNDKLLTAFYDFYKKQLQKIGFKFFGQSSIRHYYWLVFSSSNKLGLGFWNKIKRIGPNGQREFNFGEY
jgi:three-Cys-motif partner protein